MQRLVLPALFILLAGCGGAPDGRLPIEGTVTLNGKPVDSGTIGFGPAKDAPGLSAAAKIAKGRFSLSAADGLPPGEYVATVTTAAVSDVKREGPAPAKPTLPERFEKPVTIKAGQTNRVEFKLP